jgi:hypothetical protein
MLQNSEPRLFWCLGLYASGSTWIFNAAKQIAAIFEPDGRLESRFVSNASELIFSPDTSIAIIKTHEVDPDAARILNARTESIWLSVRDPRDCMTSLMMYQQCSFDESLEMLRDAAPFCMAASDDPRTVVFKYEEQFFDSPQSLDRIAGSFRKTLTVGSRRSIFSALTRSSVEALIRQFADMPTVVTQPEPGHLVDLDTQWHTHHAGRDGEIGRWRRMLSDRQQASVTDALASLMSRFGYLP